MKIYLTLFILLSLGLGAQAGVVPSWYDDCESLNEKATLVVIATPTTVKTNSEQMSFGKIYFEAPPKSEDMTGTGVETGFRIVTVLKGDSKIKTLVLRHFALVKSDSIGMKVALSDLLGPSLISFKANSKKLYLMFLQKESDGRYVAVTGQEEPVFSVKQLDDLPSLSPGALPAPDSKPF